LQDYRNECRIMCREFALDSHFKLKSVDLLRVNPITFKNPSKVNLP